MDRLVLYPQRGWTSAVFVLASVATIGAVGVGVCFGMHDSWRSLGEIGFALLFVGFVATFAADGLFSWFRRVELEARPEGVRMTWIEWPRAPRTRNLPMGDVKQVVIEVDDATRRIALVLPGEVLPLTRTSTSDDLRAKARTVSRFFGLPDEPVVLDGEARPADR